MVLLVNFTSVPFWRIYYTVARLQSGAAVVCSRCSHEPPVLIGGAVEGDWTVGWTDS